MPAMADTRCVWKGARIIPVPVPHLIVVVGSVKNIKPFFVYSQPCVIAKSGVIHPASMGITTMAATLARAIALRVN